MSQLKFLILLVVSLFTLTSHADEGIKVNVETFSSGVKGLGFTVNKKSHGSTCCDYSSKNMPKGGTYTFGIRVKHLIGGTNITCATNKGKTEIQLTTDSTAVLEYNEEKNTCLLRIVPVIRKKG